MEDYTLETTIIDLEKEYREKIKMINDLSNDILHHLHEVYDSKLESYITFDEFLVDINNYAGDTFGKVLYISYAHGIFNKQKHGTN